MSGNLSMTLGSKRASFVGTPFWMAPELLKGSLMSRESDVYAFGITLWEVMTRNIPYAELELTFQEILDQISAGSRKNRCQPKLSAPIVFFVIIGNVTPQINSYWVKCRQLPTL